MIPVLDGTGASGKSVLEGSELQTALSAIVTAVTAATAATQAVSAASLPLPTGAATQTTLAAMNTAVGYTAPADDLFAITPGTGILATIPKALLVTVAGTLAVGGTSNTSVSLGSVSVGQIIPLRARYVYATGTTATVVGLV